MARTQAKVLVTIWADDGWRALTEDAQWLFLALVSLPRERRDRTLDLDPQSWVRLAEGMDLASVLAAFSALLRSGWVVLHCGRVQVNTNHVKLPRSAATRAFIPHRVRRTVYERDRFRCVLCGAVEDLSLDHVLPWSLGGSDDAENLQTLCQPCNRRKGARV